jgi:hypothetical protein
MNKHMFTRPIRRARMMRPFNQFFIVATRSDEKVAKEICDQGIVVLWICLNGKSG